MASVSIIIVNFNGKKLLADCLDGLRDQTYRDFSVLIVDNGSNDGSLEFIQTHYPEVKIISLSCNLGFAVANNIAIRSVKTRYVALLNNDAIPHPVWLAALVDAAENNPDAGFVASKMLFYDNPKIVDRAGDDYTVAGAGNLRGRGEPSDNFNNSKFVFGACAGAALYRKLVLDDIGLFDEDFFLLYEDVDLSFRAQLGGYKCLYVPDAVVYHKASSSIVHDSPVSVYYSHRNLEWVYIHNMPFGLIKKTIFRHLIYTLGSFLYFMSKGRGGDFLRAKRDVLKGVKCALYKRRQIQGRKKVSDEYIWNLLEKERYLPRLMRRYVKSNKCR